MGILLLKEGKNLVRQHSFWGMVKKTVIKMVQVIEEFDFE